MSADDQEAWLAELYRRRNDAAHEGREYLNDLEIEEFLDLVRYTVRYAAEHLSCKHGGRRGICRTYDQALACRSWFGASN